MGKINAAREVTKTNTLDVETFQTLDFGLLGVAERRLGLPSDDGRGLLHQRVVGERVDVAGARQELTELDEQTFTDSLGSVIKDRDDLDVVERRVGSIVGGD